MRSYGNIRGQVPLVVKAGTFAITHYDLWHGTAANRSGKRRHMIKFLFARTGGNEGATWKHDPQCMNRLRDWNLREQAQDPVQPALLCQPAERVAERLLQGARDPPRDLGAAHRRAAPLAADALPWIRGRLHHVAPLFYVRDVVSRHRVLRARPRVRATAVSGAIRRSSPCPRRDGVTIMLKRARSDDPIRSNNPDPGAHGGPWDAYVWVDDARVLHAEMAAAGRRSGVRPVTAAGVRQLGVRGA